MRGKWNWWTSVRRESLASEANYDNITFFWQAKKSLNETVPPSQGLMADKPKQMQKVEKKKRILCFHSFMMFYVSWFFVIFNFISQFASRLDIEHLDLQVPHPLGMALVGSARSADRLAPAMMPVTEGKYKPIMFTKLYLGQQVTVTVHTRIRVHRFFHKDPRVEAQNSLREM